MSTVSQLGASPPQPASVPSALRASGTSVYMCGEWMRILNRLHENPTAMRTGIACDGARLDGSRLFMAFEPFKVICICGGALEPGAPMSMRIPTTSPSQNSCARAPSAKSHAGAGHASRGRSLGTGAARLHAPIKIAASGRDTGPPMVPTSSHGPYMSARRVWRVRSSTGQYLATVADPSAAVDAVAVVGKGVRFVRAAHRLVAGPFLRGEAEKKVVAAAGHNLGRGRGVLR
jgi:hypothetical protein